MGGVENPRRRGEKIRGNKWKLFSKIIEHLRLAPIWPGDEDIVIWWENVDTLFLHLEFYRCVLIAFVVFVVGPVAILADVPGDVEPVATALRLKFSDVDHEEDEGGGLVKKEWNHLKVCYCQLNVMSAWNLNIPEVEEFNCQKYEKNSSIW